MAQTQIEAKIQGLGNVLYVAAPFDKDLNALKANHSRLITARDLAYARIQDANAKNSAKASSLCVNGSYVKEGSLYVPKADNKIILVRNSLVLAHPKEATQSHRDGKQFFVDEKVAQRYSNKKDSLVLKSTDAVPTNRFAEDERTVWLFQDQAEEYGLLLKDNDINKIGAMPFSFDSQDYITQRGKPYANQLWLRWFDGASVVDGNRDLNFNDRARGVQYLSAKQTASKKIDVSYNKREVAAALNIAEGVRTGNLPASKLEKIVSLLNKL